MNRSLAAEPAASTVDDAALVERLVAGDRAAFELLMRRYNRRLYRMARAVLRDPTEAEDALQDTYLRVWRAIGQFRGEAALSTWIARLLLNECSSRLRRSARRQNVIPMVSAIPEAEIDAVADTHAELPEQTLARLEARALIERKLEELPERFRLVFLLRSVEELDVDTVAELLDIPAATVRSRHFRAKAMLRELLARTLDIAEREVFEFGGEHCDRLVARVMVRLEAGEAMRDL
ncbi:MAG TPA: RNA polymerase sigma factor [Gammaproteobacteria bacterium]|nr:RNA polymerase sigma factor [Gammaproteobacteria bacterium]